MFVTKIVISHPTNVSAYDYSAAPAQLVDEVEQYKLWALENGVTSITVTRESATSYVITYVWEGREHRDAFLAKFGQKYVDFMATWVKWVNSRGCKLTQLEESAHDVL